MKKLSTFEIVLIIIFIALALLAALIFSQIIPVGSKGKSNVAVGNVTLWSTWSSQDLQSLIGVFNQNNQTFTLTYKQKNPATFNNDLLEALASGTGPDLVILPQQSIIGLDRRLFHIPFTTFPQATYLNTYIQGGSIFLAPDGIIGFPMTVDPLIMYYNRNMLDAANIPIPPSTWDELTADVPLITRKDASGNFTRSAVAFGTFANVLHAKDIIATLLLQAGNPIVIRNTPTQISPRRFITSLEGSSGSSSNSIETILNFYTQFSDPLKSDTYSWNNTFSSDRDAFIHEDLAFYFGSASELPIIASKNPNLNFNVAPVPQQKNTKLPITFGTVQAVAMMKTSHNPATALVAAQLLSSKDFLLNLIPIMQQSVPIAPARRDMISTIPPTLWGSVFYTSAFRAQGWLDPGEDQSNAIFKTLFDDIARGAASAFYDPIQQANDKLLSALNR